MLVSSRHFGTGSVAAWANYLSNSIEGTVPDDLESREKQFLLERLGFSSSTDSTSSLWMQYFDLIGAGAAAVTALQGRGWTVTTN